MGASIADYRGRLMKFVERKGSGETQIEKDKEDGRRGIA
jgi:hypothetical protein